LKTALGFGAASLASATLGSGCSSKLTCNDVTNLSSDDLKNRADNGYVDAATDLAKTCSQCRLFKPTGEKQCGSCTLVKGQINPAGNCKNWAAKT